MPEAPNLKPSGFRQVPDANQRPPAQVEPLSARSETPPAVPSSTPPSATRPPHLPDVRAPRVVSVTQPSIAVSSVTDRLRWLLPLGVALFALLGVLTSYIAIPRMEDHLQAEALERLEAAGIQGATVELDGRTATIAGLSGSDAERAEEILDDEWGIRDAVLADDNDQDPEPVEVSPDTVAPPGTSNPPTDDSSEDSTTEDADDTTPEDGDDVDQGDDEPADASAPVVEPPAAQRDLNAELAGLQERLNDAQTFAPGSATLTEDAEEVLAETAGLLSDFPEATIQIDGHTDDDGAELDNLLLSQNRADAVAEFLTGRGITAQRLVAVGLGENNPVADNATAEGRLQNRRIEFAVLG